MWGWWEGKGGLEVLYFHTTRLVGDRLVGGSATQSRWAMGRVLGPVGGGFGMGCVRCRMVGSCGVHEGMSATFSFCSSTLWLAVARDEKFSVSVGASSHTRRACSPIAELTLAPLGSWCIHFVRVGPTSVVSCGACQ